MSHILILFQGFANEKNFAHIYETMTSIFLQCNLSQMDSNQIFFVLLTISNYLSDKNVHLQAKKCNL